MNVLLTIEDLPHNKPNCGNCTRQGASCPRREKRFPNGYVKSHTGEIGGIICGCQHYTGSKHYNHQ